MSEPTELPIQGREKVSRHYKPCGVARTEPKNRGYKHSLVDTIN